MASSTSLSHPLSLSRNRTIGPLQAALEGIMACTSDTFDRTSPPPLSSPSSASCRQQDNHQPFELEDMENTDMPELIRP